MLKKSIFILLSLACFAANAQVVTTYCGQPATAGFNNQSVTLSNARFTEPNGIVLDASGNIYISEQGSHRIRLITIADATIYTRAGNSGDPSGGLSAGYLNNTGINSRFNSPVGIDLDAAGNIYVADQLNHSIRKITKFTSVGSGQVVTTFAGEAPGPNAGTGDYKNGQGTAARFDVPMDVAVDANGNVFVADAFNYCIRKIDASGNVTLIAGTPGVSGYQDGAAATAMFELPVAIELENQGSLLVADANNRLVRRIDLATLQVSTVAGTGTQGGTDGAAASAQFSTPNGLAVDAFGSIFVSDGRSGQANTIRKIKNGQVTTLAGQYGTSGTTDGTGTAARFESPGHIAFNTTKDVLYVADVYNHTIRKIELKPIADFSTFSTNINVGVEISLTNTSINNPTGYKWKLTPATGFSFTSGTSDTSTTPKLTFTQSGSYTVELTASNEYGNSVKLQSNYINVSNTGGGNAPIADFDVLPRNLATGFDTLTLKDKSTNNPTLWQWTITPSDAVYILGTGSASQNPKVRFTKNGVYTVSLKATNPLGENTKTKVNYIGIFPLGVQELTLDELVNVYPNPTAGNLTIDLGQIPVANTLTVAVFDIQGRNIYENILFTNPGKIELNLDNYGKGLYFVTVYDGTNKINKTVVVE